MGLIARAFIIALATILIYFIFTPRKRFQIEERRNQVQEPVHSLVAPKENAKSLASTVARA